MFLMHANLHFPSVFTGVRGPPAAGRNVARIALISVLFSVLKRSLLDRFSCSWTPSRQFVGDLERAQDGAQIAPKWSQERFAERKGGSSICSKIFRVLAPRKRPKRPQDRSQEASGRHRSAVQLSKISSLPRSIQLLNMI